MEYIRASLHVSAVPYEVGKGLEDGFEDLTKVITNGWITTDFLVKVKEPNGQFRCPFITNKRGKIFIGEGDYIITESDGERHVCSEKKFFLRFKPVQD